MGIEIGDRSLMMIFLLEECNLACVHCAREDAPMQPGYKLSFEQLQSCLSDCRNLESVSWVHFSGGEPTLWTDGNLNLIDILLEISKAGFTPGFTSNGSFFVDYGKCHDFFSKYVDDSAMPLRVYLSVDVFHRNFNMGKGRARILDNVFKCRRSLPRAKADLLDIKVLTVVSKDPGLLLPDEMIRHYKSLGATFVFTPLIYGGKAKSFGHLCPDLSSEKPEDMGAYWRFHREKTRKKQGVSRNQEGADHIILIGSDYYFTDPWCKVGRLGHLPDTIIGAYSKKAGA